MPPNNDTPNKHICFLFDRQAPDGHVMFVGPSGRGKSNLPEDEAHRLGVAYAELARQMPPGNDERQKRAARKSQEQLADARRIHAVKAAYWMATDPDAHDLHMLHDALVEHIEFPTETQRRELFFMLPDRIIGSGIAWGFSDTEVRDDIYKFVQTNLEAVLTKLSAL